MNLRITHCPENIQTTYLMVIRIIDSSLCSEAREDDLRKKSIFCPPRTTKLKHIWSSINQRRWAAAASKHSDTAEFGDQGKQSALRVAEVQTSTMKDVAKVSRESFPNGR